jgi:hypothetical protein
MCTKNATPPPFALAEKKPSLPKIARNYWTPAFAAASM